LSSSSLTRLLQEALNVQLGKETTMERANKRKSCCIEEDESALLNIFQSLHQTMGGNLFEKVVRQVEFQMTHNRPRFPDGIVVSNIPRDEEMENLERAEPELPAMDTVEATSQSNNVSETSDMNGGSFSQVQRIPTVVPPGRIGVQQMRDLQFHRWDWCCENMVVYINMLRQSGHSDELISDMILIGKPLCIPSGAMFRDFKESLRGLKSWLEKDAGWTNFSFVMTGSSVCGFSQNFLSPFRDGSGCTPYSPTGINIASYFYEGGVDDTLTLCIQANGVKLFMDELITCGDSQLIRSYPSTCTRNMGGLRYRFLQENGYSLVSNYLSAWNKEWAPTLSGVGLEITFGEDSLVIPPWEVRLDMHDISQQGETVYDGALVSPTPSFPLSPTPSPPLSPASSPLLPASSLTSSSKRLRISVNTSLKTNTASDQDHDKEHSILWKRPM